MLSNFAFKFNLRRYIVVDALEPHVREELVGRGLHSFTSQLNLGAFYGKGDARRDCPDRVKGVLGGV
jgi:hypothetical protein